MDLTFNLLCGSANLTGHFVKTLTFEYTGNSYMLPMEWDVSTDNNKLTIIHTDIHTESDLFKVDDDLNSLKLTTMYNKGKLNRDTIRKLRLDISLEVDMIKVYPTDEEEDDEVTINYNKLYTLLDKMSKYITKTLITSYR